jgi:hypothetical protein
VRGGLPAVHAPAHGRQRCVSDARFCGAPVALPSLSRGPRGSSAAPPQRCCHAACLRRRARRRVAALARRARAVMAAQSCCVVWVCVCPRVCVARPPVTFARVCAALLRVVAAVQAHGRHRRAAAAGVRPRAPDGHVRVLRRPRVRPAAHPAPVHPARRGKGTLCVCTAVVRRVCGAAATGLCLVVNMCRSVSCVGCRGCARSMLVLCVRCCWCYVVDGTRGSSRLCVACQRWFRARVLAPLRS